MLSKLSLTNARNKRSQGVRDLFQLEESKKISQRILSLILTREDVNPLDRRWFNIVGRRDGSRKDRGVEKQYGS